jgi:hypothetical protein
MILYLTGAVALATILITLSWDSSRLIGRHVNAIFTRFPRGRAFVFGALFGVYAGLMPAFIVYALIRREWAAELVDASFALACGVGWVRVGDRPRERKQPAPKQRKGRIN